MNNFLQHFPSKVALIKAWKIKFSKFQDKKFIEIENIETAVEHNFKTKNTEGNFFPGYLYN